MSRSAVLRGQLVRVGEHVSERNLARLRSVLGYLEIGALAHERLGRSRLPMVADRFAVFAEAVRHVSGPAPLYLEFGVYRGETMRWWSEHLHQPGARLVGFDSFKGLPEPWRPGFARGRFETHGPPVVADERVQFVAGWFEDTLPAFVPPPHDQLVVNVDSDLYSSAKTVLHRVAPGSAGALYFDELADRDHELRALKEIIADRQLDVRPLVAGGGGTHVLFEVI